MGKKLYIGNLPFSASENALAQSFSQAGVVESAMIVMDRETGRSKGFGFIEMSTDEEAQRAIEQFNGQQFEGRALTVNEARPQAPRENRGGFGGGNRGGFGGGNRGGRDRY